MKSFDHSVKGRVRYFHLLRVIEFCMVYQVHGYITGKVSTIHQNIQTCGEKHAQQVLQASGPGSAQAAGHSSVQRGVYLLPRDVMLSAAKHLARWAHRCFTALSMTAKP